MRSGVWVLPFGLGVALVVLSVSSVLKTLLVPRGRPSRLTALLEEVGRRLFVVLTRRQRDFRRVDELWSAKGPVIVLLVLMTWLGLVLVGYAFMLWAVTGNSFPTALRESGSSMLTLGFESSEGPVPTVLDLLAGATGIGILTLQIAYLPTLYAAFNRREIAVTTLESRAGSPAWGPEILARHQLVGIVDDLAALYAAWEGWAADVAETHTNYPVLISFRSPHPLRSWVIALLAVLDAAAIHLAIAPRSAPSKARLCLRMGITCLRDLADVLRVPYDPDPHPEDPIQLGFDDFAVAVKDIERIGFSVERGVEEAWPHFRGWRVNYEAVAYTLADRITAPPAPWSGTRRHFPHETIYPDRPAHREPT